MVLRFKLLKWWAQSFLPGVPRVVAGFRDHDGVVVAVETFSVSEISHLIKVHSLLQLTFFFNYEHFLFCTFFVFSVWTE